MNANVLCCAASLALTALTYPLTASSATPTTDGYQVNIISPANGATVSSPVNFQFEPYDKGETHAGVRRNRTGHNHLLIDGKMTDMIRPLGGDVKRIDGKTKVSLDLKPGIHTLQLIRDDHIRPTQKPIVVSEQITFTVE